MSSEPSAISVDETAVMTAVGAAIVARRTELKISQQALARTVGTSRTFLRGIEAGERAPTVVTLTRIARALHTTPSALITTIRCPGPATLCAASSHPEGRSPLAYRRSHATPCNSEGIRCAFLWIFPHKSKESRNRQGGGIQRTTNSMSRRFSRNTEIRCSPCIYSPLGIE